MTARLGSLHEERRGDVSVLQLPDRVTLGQTIEDLQRTVRELAERGACRVVLDLSSTSYLDSAGIGALVSAYTAIQASGGMLALAGVGKRVEDLLQLTKLYTVFDSYGSVDEAVAALRPREGQ